MRGKKTTACVVVGRLTMAALASLVMLSAQLDAAEKQLDAKTLFEKSTGSQVQLAKDGKHVELSWGELIEDDAPAAGYSYKPNVEDLSTGAWIKKGLVIPQAKAKRALLLLGPAGDIPSSILGGYTQGITSQTGPRKDFHVIINGQPQTLTFEGETDLIWDVYSFSPEALKPGNNEIVMHGAGKMWIARDDEYAAGAGAGATPPNRSAKSTDGGKTWDDKHLGPKGDIDGEYYVRVLLDHYRSQGSFTLPVIDAGNLAGSAIAPPLTDIGPIKVAIDAEAVAAGKIKLRARTGTSLSPTEKDWSAWQEVSFPNGVIEKPTGRFVQVAIDLSTDDALQTPAIKGVKIEASPKLAADWTKEVRVVEQKNAEIVRTSIPFVYEPYDQVSLKKLRQDYHLDQILSGTKDEFEQIIKLADWSSHCMKGHHLRTKYPDWNALQILSVQDDGTPLGGYCQQYNLVFLQACESFGLPARAVSLGPNKHSGKALRGGGHEVTEVWSNQYQKWMYIDGHLAWYAVDAKTRVPLSLWELRERQLAMIAGEPNAPIDIVSFADNHRMKWEGLLSDQATPFAELRLMPRSNFLSQPTPVPLNQGMIGWFWNGFHVWTDEKCPAALFYGNRVTRKGDFEWTLNQAQVALLAQPVPGQLQVQLDTETPGLDSLLARTDDGEAKPVASGFTWTLKPGRNRLEVWPRNKAGRDGSKSFVVLDYTPASR